jgi:electron transfer flavoprotein beta subunit
VILFPRFALKDLRLVLEAADELGDVLDLDAGLARRGRLEPGVVDLERRVGREVDGGVITLRLKLPAVVTVDLRIVAPTSVYSLNTAPTFKYNDGVRFAALPAIMAAKKKPLTELKLADLAPDTALKVHYAKFEAPPARKAGVKVKDVAELVNKLKNEAKVL